MLAALRLSSSNRWRAAKWITVAAKAFQRFGSTYGYLEARLAGGTAMIRGEGQRMASLPIALAASLLVEGRLTKRGWLTPAQAIGDDTPLGVFGAMGIGITDR